MINIKQIFWMMALVVLFCFTGCGSDEPEINQEEKDKTRGIFTAKIDNVFWAAEKIEIGKNTKSELVTVGTGGGKTLALLFISRERMPSDIKTFEFGKEYNEAFMLQLEYYTPELAVSETAIAGTINVVKLDADSLVANFNLTTEHKSLTEGKIKIRLKN